MTVFSNPQAIFDKLRTFLKHFDEPQRVSGSAGEVLPVSAREGSLVCTHGRYSRYSEGVPLTKLGGYAERVSEVSQIRYLFCPQRVFKEHAADLRVVVILAP